MLAVTSVVNGFVMMMMMLSDCSCSLQPGCCRSDVFLLNIVPGCTHPTQYRWCEVIYPKLGWVPQTRLPMRNG